MKKILLTSSILLSCLAYGYSETSQVSNTNTSNNKVAKLTNIGESQKQLLELNQKNEILQYVLPGRSEDSIVTSLHVYPKQNIALISVSKEMFNKLTSTNESNRDKFKGYTLKIKIGEGNYSYKLADAKIIQFLVNGGFLHINIDITNSGAIDQHESSNEPIKLTFTK